MKKVLNTLLLILCFLCVPLSAKASLNAVVNGNDVRIRSGAGTNNSIVATVNSNTSISVVDKTLYSGTGCSAKWYKITYNDSDAYICSTYVTFITSSYSGINVLDWISRVNGNNVAVRKTANASSSKVDTLSLGVNVTILDTVNGGTSGCSGGKWYKIKYYIDSSGYICKNYVTIKSEITSTNSDYSQVLKDAGFPESYYPYLTYLHNKYPAWVFKADNTGLDFSYSVSSEGGKCYMQTTNDNYRTSTKPSEGSSWFKINSGVIAFYMDPRNWLNESRIFMFEKLTYANELESSYPALVKAIFGSGTLSQDKYTTPMLTAGKKYLISPVHIASRIRLEVGANGNDSTNGKSFTWLGKTYSGYYNFFNIGAYEVTIDGVSYSAITRGLACARDNGWDNIETAIIEGSSFLANAYVTKGQETIYYQKFNVGSETKSSYYTHQYMTNVQAPATEGSSAYSSYNKAKMLNNTFIFEIPVYKNMPEYTSLPNSGNSNYYLSSLGISGYTITPSFDEDITYYESYVPLELNKVTINATTASNKSSISGIGTYELTSDENAFTISVTSESGVEKKYEIVVKRAKGNISIEQALSNIGGKLNDNYITNLKNGSIVSQTNNYLTSAGAVSSIITDSKGVNIENNNIITTGYKLKLTTGNGVNTYTLVVNGDSSGDGKITILDLLQVRKHINKDSILKNEKFYAADTSGDGDITILDLLQLRKHINGDKKL